MQRFHMPIMNLLQQSVSGTKTLIPGVKELDRLFEGLRCGELLVFYGSQICHSISELLCVRSQLPNIEGGLDSSVVFVDGGNLFDPYFISENARLFGLNPEETLRNIWISRAFTSYQMVALITQKLRPIIDKTGSKIVVISDIPALFCDSSIGTSEAIRTFNTITLFLWKLVREKDIVLIASSLSSRSKRKNRLEQYLLCRADVVAKVEAGNPHPKITLEKHPSKSQEFKDLFLGEPNIKLLS